MRLDMTEEQLLTRKQLAYNLQVSERYINRYEKKGLPVIRIAGSVHPRYKYSDVMKWVRDFKPGKK